MAQENNAPLEGTEQNTQATASENTEQNAQTTAPEEQDKTKPIDSEKVEPVNPVKTEPVNTANANADLNAITEEEILEQIEEHMKHARGRLSFKVGKDTVSIYPQDARNYTAEDILSMVETQMGKIDELSVEMDDGSTVKLFNRNRKKQAEKDETETDLPGGTSEGSAQEKNENHEKIHEFDDGMRGIEVQINGKRVDRNEFLKYIYEHKTEFMYSFAEAYSKASIQKENDEQTYSDGYVAEQGKAMGDKLLEKANKALASEEQASPGPVSQQETGHDEPKTENSEPSAPKPEATASRPGDGQEKPHTVPQASAQISKQDLRNAALMIAKNKQASTRDLMIRLGRDNETVKEILGILVKSGTVARGTQSGMYVANVTEEEANARYPAGKEEAYEKPKADLQTKERFRHEFDGIVAKSLRNGQKDFMISNYKGMRVTRDPDKNNGRLTYERLDAKRMPGGKVMRDESGNIELKSRWLTFDEACLFYEENHEKLTSAMENVLGLTHDEVIRERGSADDKGTVNREENIPFIPEPEVIPDADYAAGMKALHESEEKMLYDGREEEALEESARQAAANKRRKAARNLDETRKDGRGSVDGGPRIDTTRRSNRSNARPRVDVPEYPEY